MNGTVSPHSSTPGAVSPVSGDVRMTLDTGAISVHPTVFDDPMRGLIPT
jgi:hypothetical protein